MYKKLMMHKKSAFWVVVQGAWRAKIEIVQIVQRDFEHDATRQYTQEMDF